MPKKLIALVATLAGTAFLFSAGWLLLSKEELPTISTAQVENDAFQRARALMAAGKLREAVEVLKPLPKTSVEATRLRAQITEEMTYVETLDAAANALNTDNLSVAQALLEQAAPTRLLKGRLAELQKIADDKAKARVAPKPTVAVTPERLLAEAKRSLAKKHYNNTEAVALLTHCLELDPAMTECFEERKNAIALSGRGFRPGQPTNQSERQAEETFVKDFQKRVPIPQR